MSLVQRIFLFGILAVLLTPTVVVPWFYAPFQNTKAIVFLGLMELLFPLYLYFFLSEGRTRLKADPILIAFFVFLFVQVLASPLGLDVLNSLFGNTDRPGGVFLLLHVGLFFLYLQLIAGWGKQQILQQAQRVLIIGAGIVAVYGIGESLQMFPSLAEPYLPRASSLFGNPVFFGSFLVVPCLLSFMQALEKTNRRWVYLCVSFILFLGIVSSGTRAALLALLVGGLVFSLVSLFKSRIRVSRRAWISIVLSIALLVSVFIVIGGVAQEGTLAWRLTHPFSESSSQRLNYWSVAWQGWMDHPWLGVGPENFYIPAQTYYRPEFYTFVGSWPDKPHNAFLEVLVTSGLIGFLAYLTFLFFFFVRAWSHHQAPWILASAAALLTTTFFSFETMGSWVMWGVLFLFLIPSEIHTWPPLWIPRFPRRVILSTASVLSLVVVMVGVGAHAKTLLDLQELSTLQESDPLVSAEVIHRVHSGSPFFINDQTVARLSLQTLSSLQGLDAPPELVENLFSDTQALYARATDRHPYSARTWNEFAGAFGAAAQAAGSASISPLAFTYADRALALAPGRIEPIVTKGRLALTQGDVTTAASNAQEAITRAPTDAEAWALSLWVIDVLAQQGNTGALIEWLTYLLEIRPQEYQLYEMLVSVYSADGQEPLALETARTLLLLDPGNHPLIQAYVDSHDPSP